MRHLARLAASKVLPYQPLESRHLLAGDVSVRFAGSTLLIDGDAVDNHVRIETVGTGIQVVGVNTSVNGMTTAVFSTIPKRINFRMKDGHDTVEVSALAFDGNLRFDGGKGNDVFRVSGLQSKSLMLSGGRGDDVVDLNDITLSARSSIRTSKGNDAIAIKAISTGGPLVIDTQQGHDTVTTFGVDIDDRLKVRLGSGDDNCLLNGSTKVAGQALVNLGAGSDFLGVHPGEFAASAELERNFKVVCGPDDDQVSFDASVDSAHHSIHGGAGNADALSSRMDEGAINASSFENLNPAQVRNRVLSNYQRLEKQGIDASLLGKVILKLDPVTQRVTINEATPTISVQWDQLAQEAVIALKTGPTIASRVYAMLHTAMYDAWSAYDEPASSTTMGDQLQRPLAENTDANKRKAMSFAAHRILRDLFPGQAAMFDGLMNQLGYNPANASTDTTTAAGIGNAMAAKLLQLRHADGSNQLGNANNHFTVPYSDTTGYQPVNSVGDTTVIEKWTPERVPVDALPGMELRVQSFLTPHWGQVLPFGYNQPAAFRPAAPEPFLLVAGTVDLANKTITTTSDNVTHAISKGLIGTIINPGFIRQAETVVQFSSGLTDHQKMIAEFWEDGGGTSFPPGTWMTFGEFVSARDDHSLDQDAKMFFMLGNAVMDAGIATWEAKAFYDYTRPLRAVRALGELGLIGEFDAALGGFAVDAWKPGEGTVRQLATDFLTYQTPGSDPSPPFAEYTSGHSSFSSAAATILESFTGSDYFGASVSFAPGSSRFEPGITPNVTESLVWETFREAADEAGISRLYGGIHFSDGDMNGRKLGREVAHAVWDRAFELFGSES